MIAKAEAKKLPAKVRVLFEFTPPASLGPTEAAEIPAASPVDIRAYLASHEDEAAEALDNYIVASDQPYGKRLRELISHKVLEDRDIGLLVEFRYIGWDSPYAKQIVLARLERDGLALYDPKDAARLAALPPLEATPEPEQPPAAERTMPLTSVEQIEDQIRSQGKPFAIEVAKYARRSGLIVPSVSYNTSAKIKSIEVKAIEPHRALVELYYELSERHTYLVQHRHDPIAVRDRQRPARTEIPLHVDHEDRGDGGVLRPV